MRFGSFLAETMLISAIQMKKSAKADPGFLATHYTVHRFSMIDLVIKTVKAKRHCCERKY
jgi:hypothetical protein